MIVLDASAVLELLLRTERGRTVEQRITPIDETLHAPHLLDIEVSQILRRYLLRGALDEVRAREALQDLLDLEVERYPHDALLPRIWDLRHNATAYDAAYLALAEALGAPLLTSDTRLAAAAGSAVSVEVL